MSKFERSDQIRLAIDSRRPNRLQSPFRCYWRQCLPRRSLVYLPPYRRLIYSVRFSRSSRGTERVLSGGRESSGINVPLRFHSSRRVTSISWPPMGHILRIPSHWRREPFYPEIHSRSSSCSYVIDGNGSVARYGGFHSRKWSEKMEEIVELLDGSVH